MGMSEGQAEQVFEMETFHENSRIIHVEPIHVSDDFEIAIQSPPNIENNSDTNWDYYL